MNTNKLALTSALLRRSLDQQRRQGDDATKAATVALIALARARKRCRILNDAYDAAENKPEVRLSIQESMRHLRELHATLPARLRRKSWISTIEYYDSWTLEARKSA